MVKNPYIETRPFEGVIDVYAPVSRNDHAFIKGIRPTTSTNSAVIGTLWKAFCDELRKQGIVDFSRTDDFDNFLNNIHVVSDSDYQQLLRDSASWQGQLASSTGRGLSNGPASGTVSKRTSPQRRSRSQSSDANTATTNVASDVPSRGGGQHKGTQDS